MHKKKLNFVRTINTLKKQLNVESSKNIRSKEPHAEQINRGYKNS